MDLDHRIEICKGIYNKEITIVSDRKSANADWSDAIFCLNGRLSVLVCLKGKAVGIVSKNTIISW
ncbi:hypothetical protein EFT68_02245 [Lactiplantibacillus plantarum]|nr:hypothetical protein [Lactiplantibacillus plantarum]MCT3548920.1 hypothetical protein [Lactiplantibacillus plantarum]